MSENQNRPIDPLGIIEPVPAVSPECNVLPRTATRDEVDVHWFFNWAEADIATTPFYSPYERGLLGERSKVRSSVPEPGPRECAAAGRSSQVRRVLVQMEPRLVSALARWAASPRRIPEAPRTLFGRLAGVAVLTPAVDSLGGAHAFIANCQRAVEKRDKDGAANFLRHQARVSLVRVRAEAEALARQAFEVYARERARLAAEPKRRPTTPGRRALAAMAARNEGGADALARLMARARSR